MTESVRVSLVFTVLNEAGSISRLLDSIAGQRRLPDEIVVVDGGSTDQTVAIIRTWAEKFRVPLHLLELPGANISAGRNAAIATAVGDIIAVTDAGVRLDPDWLARLVAPFEEAEPPDVVSGFFVPDLAARDRPAGVFPTALAATVLPAVSDINPALFLPSSRSVAFRRTAWEAAAGYPEWLDYCEDLVFDLTLRALGRRFHFEPGALVSFAPRTTWRAFFLQYYRYARGDGKADLWRKRHAIRYATYLVGTAGLCWILRRPSPSAHRLLPTVPLALGAAAYCRRPTQRYLALTTEWPAGRRMRGLALMPLIRAWGDLAKMAGYPAGCWWRLRRSRTRS